MHKQLEHLEFLKKHTEETCSYLSKKSINKIQFFSFGMINRIRSCSAALLLLLKEMEREPSLEFSVGIVYRSLILDALLGFKIYKEIDDLEKDGKSETDIEAAINETCNSYLSDGLKHTLSYIEDAEKFGLKAADETKAAFKNMYRLFKPFFEEYKDDGSKPIVKYQKNYTAKGIFEQLAKTSDLKELSKLYDTYAYFSKYDHFGIMYYHLINLEKEVKLETYLHISESIVAHNAFLHVILKKYSHDDPFMKKQMDTANEYLLEKVIKAH